MSEEECAREECLIQRVWQVDRPKRGFCLFLRRQARVPDHRHDIPRTIEPDSIPVHKEWYSVPLQSCPIVQSNVM